MTTVLTILIIIIAIPIFCDIAIDESHICKTILGKIPLYNKIVDYIDDHSTFFGWLLFCVCILIIYPLCFNWGYNNTNRGSTQLGYVIPPQKLNGYPNPAYITYNLKNQIYNNDSLFIVKLSSTDSVVYNRKMLRLEIKSDSQIPLSNFDRYENCNKFQKMVLEALVIPTWKEVKDNFSFSSNGKKGWIICCMIAGYFGYNQGVKCRNTEISYENLKEWNRIQNLLNDENWWQKLANDYPYQKDKFIIDENHPFGCGIGIDVEVENNSIFVEDVTDGSPAQKAGIIPGDKIVSIDGTSTIEEADTIVYIFSHLRGRKSTSVKLGIQRGTNDTTVYNLNRVPMALPLWILIDEPKIQFE